MKKLARKLHNEEDEHLSLLVHDRDSHSLDPQAVSRLLHGGDLLVDDYICMFTSLPHILHESWHHHAYAFNKLFDLQNCIPFVFMIFNFHRKWVQAIGLFAQATCAPEFGLPRPFNQRLLVLHAGGGAVKQRGETPQQPGDGRQRATDAPPSPLEFTSAHPQKGLSIAYTTWPTNRRPSPKPKVKVLAIKISILADMGSNQAHAFKKRFSSSQVHVWK
ncbi:hypothetical protein JHK86_040333 [Glycine max]|nr:hypothetical protein JHK86_040333 [Glycine max]